jgi:hypothetical protein
LFSALSLVLGALSFSVPVSIDKITDQLEVIENDLFTVMPTREKIERIYRLRAGLLNMRHAFSPMIEICNQLGRDPRGAGSHCQHLRDEFRIHARTGVVIRLSRRVIVDTGDLLHSLLSIPKDRLAVTSLSGRT